MERGGFRGGRGGPPRGGPGRGRGGFNPARGRGGLGVRGGMGRGGGGGVRGAGVPRGRGGVFNPSHSNVLVVSSRGRGGITDGARGIGMRGTGGRGAFRGGIAGVAAVENKFRGRGGRGGDRGGMMGRGLGRGAGGAERGALKRVQPTGGIPPKRGRYDATQPNGYNQYQGYEQATPEGYGPPQTAAPVSYGGQYNNGSYGGGYGASQAQTYGSQGYGGYGQAQSYDSVGADYASGYAPAQDSRYSAQQPDPYGDYAKPTRHYETDSYSAGYGQASAATSYQAGYDDRSGYATQSYDAAGYGAQAIPSAQPYDYENLYH